MCPARSRWPARRCARWCPDRGTSGRFGVIAGWEWDEALFAGAAEHYLRGRLPYAPGFAESTPLPHPAPPYERIGGWRKLRR
jgi:hypothetical protein